jgi:hypothetical protein
VLHVVLFEGSGDALPALTSAGRELPLLVLAPLLREGLEAYAMHDAIMALEKTDPLELAAPLLALPLGKRREQLWDAARVRWEQKCIFAQRRLKAAGSWSEACHQVMLEILGYRRNRGPMAELAVRYPFEVWKAMGPSAVLECYEEKRGAWRVQGSRPANHPRRRLEQYAELMRQAENWPELLQKLLRQSLAQGDAMEQTQAFRRRLKLSALRKEILTDVWHGCLASPRADTILIDGILPLAAASMETEEQFFPYWLHWWPGDLPDALKVFLRTIGVVTPYWPLSNGLQQAALQCLIEREG